MDSQNKRTSNLCNRLVEKLGFVDYLVANNYFGREATKYSVLGWDLKVEFHCMSHTLSVSVCAVLINALNHYPLQTTPYPSFNYAGLFPSAPRSYRFGPKKKLLFALFPFQIAKVKSGREKTR